MGRSPGATFFFQSFWRCWRTWKDRRRHIGTSINPSTVGRNRRKPIRAAARNDEAHRSCELTRIHPSSIHPSIRSGPGSFWLIQHIFFNIWFSLSSCCCWRHRGRRKEGKWRRRRKWHRNWPEVQRRKSSLDFWAPSSEIWPRSISNGTVNISWLRSLRSSIILRPMKVHWFHLIHFSLIWFDLIVGVGSVRVVDWDEALKTAPLRSKCLIWAY